MNRIVIVLPYFGRFKPSITLYLESCNRNPDVDFLIFTDCSIPDHLQLLPHIHWIPTTLDAIRALAEEKLSHSVALLRAYKLCDLRPFYGLIFSDYLQNYDYWGYGDTDVVYGRLTSFLNQIAYQQYDKINWMGHLCLIRNNASFNQAAFLAVPNTVDAQTVLQSESNLGFDERDFNLKCLAASMKIYTGRWAADIDIFYWRMRCVDLKTYHLLLDTRDIHYAPRNSSKQLFALINGAIYRVYLKGKKVCLEEYAYIHFRKEVPILLDQVSSDTYIFSREGFISVGDAEVFKDYSRTLSLIQKHNNQENTLQELHCFVHHYIRKITGKRGW